MRACSVTVVVPDAQHSTHRHLADIVALIDGSRLSERAKRDSRAIFQLLAQAEGRVHGVPVEQVHFHEVGAVDTIVDVVGFFALLEALRVEDIVIGTIPVGGGRVEIEHGSMSVPAPATVELLRGFPIVGGPEEKELTTPTGALLIGQAGARPGLLPPMLAEEVGYGSGSMRLNVGPNVLRAVLGHPLGSSGGASPGGSSASSVGSVLLETNLDDVSPETVAHACEKLRQAGALDVWVTPAFTKKQRPGMMISVLSSPENEDALVELMFRETGTLGIRRHATGRYVAERGFLTVEVAGRPVAVKWGRWRGGPRTFAAEYEIGRAHV
jgi:pyridinium-3,5-bisthiocarboxylic acid mononucleotide nickel chelatase